jgi:hypothetical protein
VGVEERGKDGRSDSEEKRVTIRDAVVKQIMKWAG